MLLLSCNEMSRTISPFISSLHTVFGRKLYAVLFNVRLIQAANNIVFHLVAGLKTKAVHIFRKSSFKFMKELAFENFNVKNIATFYMNLSHISRARKARLCPSKQNLGSATAYLVIYLVLILCLTCVVMNYSSSDRLIIFSNLGV